MLILFSFQWNRKAMCTLGEYQFAQQWFDFCGRKEATYFALDVSLLSLIDRKTSTLSAWFKMQITSYYIFINSHFWFWYVYAAWPALNILLWLQRYNVVSKIKFVHTAYQVNTDVFPPSCLIENLVVSMISVDSTVTKKEYNKIDTRHGIQYFLSRKVYV